MPLTNILSPFTKKSKRTYGPGSKVVTVSLRRCSSKGRPQMPRTESTESCSSEASTSTLRGCLELVKRGVSTMLMIPMPFWDSSNSRDCVSRDSFNEMSDPRGLKRILSRRRSQVNGKRRNSLVLPEVPMSDEPDEPKSPVIRRPSECTIRESPPPFEDRTVRFVVQPGKRSRFTDDGPAWCDFMQRVNVNLSHAQ
ncbi:hypothetical protein DFH06DRAFT_1143686 [Mycena polygramma]|nr:hypothetical protein DFH06DRAFT_1143686 [Mycena polygramma]